MSASTQPPRSPPDATAGGGSIDVGSGSRSATTNTKPGGWFGPNGLEGSSGWKQTDLILQACKTGLVGMIAGTLYGLLKGGASEKGVLIELDPQPEAFDLDDMAPILFAKLAKYRHLHEAAYVKALGYCDSVFVREREICRSKRPNAADEPLVQTFIDACIGNIILLRERAAAKDGQMAGAIGILKDEIADMLKEHRSRVYHLCASTRY